MERGFHLGGIHDGLIVMGGVRTQLEAANLHLSRSHRYSTPTGILWPRPGIPVVIKSRALKKMMSLHAQHEQKQQDCKND
jgi:hypothetical protein